MLGVCTARLPKVWMNLYVYESCPLYKDRESFFPPHHSIPTRHEEMYSNAVVYKERFYDCAVQYSIFCVLQENPSLFIILRRGILRVPTHRKQNGLLGYMISATTLLHTPLCNNARTSPAQVL